MQNCLPRVPSCFILTTDLLYKLACINRFFNDKTRFFEPPRIRLASSWTVMFTDCWRCLGRQTLISVIVRTRFRRASFRVPPKTPTSFVRAMFKTGLACALSSGSNGRTLFQGLPRCARARRYSRLTEQQAELMRKKLPQRKPIKGVKHIVLVASGKGGVGKSTTAGESQTRICQSYVCGM